MGGLLKMGQETWQMMKWGAPPSVERILLPHLHKIKELVLPVIRPYLDVCELRGQGKGSPLTVTFVGLDYFRPYLKSVMFTEEPEEIRQGTISVWHPDDIAAVSDSDIVIVTGSERFIRRLPRRRAVVLPLFVDHVLDVCGDWEDVKKRLRRSKSVRNEFSWLQRYDYTYEISHDHSDFEMYHSTMYSPTMEKRHGDAAILVSKEEDKQHFLRGFLLLVKRNGHLVAGGVCRPQGKQIKFITLGVPNADEQLLKENVIGALYISLIRWANEAGYGAVNFLGVPPYLDLGIFQYKRKWGTTISIPPNSHKQFWFSFQHDTPAARQFLKDNPCVVVDEEGELHGLIVVDDVNNITPATEKQLYERYYTPGMKDLLLRSPDDLFR
jgi:hypothetical protein